MKIEVMDNKKTKSEAIKYISKKLPLASKVVQFNSVIENMHIEYIEFKILRYEVLVKKKNIYGVSELKKEIINIIVNTSNGRSKSVKEIPKTTQKYVTKSYMRANNIDNEKLTSQVTKEVINYLTKKKLLSTSLLINNTNIELVEMKSIYKACWIADFRGRNVIIDME